MAFTSYFHRTLRYQNLEYKDIKIIEKHYELSNAIRENTNKGCTTLKEWCNIEEYEIPDQRAIDYYKSEYKLREKFNEIYGNYSTYSVIEEIGHVREMHFMHKWIKDNLLNSTNTKLSAIELTKENIEQLLKICEHQSLEKQYSSKIEHINITKTNELLKYILETTDFEKQIIFYNTLWI